MLNNLFENILNKSKTSISELLNNKILIFYILLGMFIVYVSYNILTNTIKYPIIITLGVILGKYLCDYYNNNS
tara:strand:+ start:275 stop:493 length:219 start_codon:yes stop_codon:yes gene_type:complete